MSVMGHWRRSALGASGVALLLPVGLMLGVALTSTLGGGATLRALGQILQGPAAPAARSAPGLEAARDVPAVPVRRRARPITAGTPAEAAGGATSDPATDRPAGDAPQPSPPQTSPGAPGGGGGPFLPADDPQAPPPPSGSTVHQVGRTVADGVSALPAPAGPTAGDAMQSVVDLIP